MPWDAGWAKPWAATACGAGYGGGERIGRRAPPRCLPGVREPQARGLSYEELQTKVARVMASASRQSDR